MVKRAAVQYMKLPLPQQCKTIKQLQQLHSHTITSGHLLPLSPHSLSHFLTKVLHSFTLLLSSTHHSHTSQSLLTYALPLFTSIPLLVSNTHSKPSFLPTTQITLSTFCYNNIIRIHTLLSYPLSALILFSRMRRLLIPPDFHTFPFALNACSHLRSLSIALTLHSQSFKFGFIHDLFVFNSLLHVYCINGCLDYARHLFDQSSYRDIISYNTLLEGFVKARDIGLARHLFDTMPIRDVVSWGTIMAGYNVHTNQQREIIHLFNKMLDSQLKPDNVALVSVLSACAQLGELEQGKFIHEYIKINRIRVDSFLSTGLVDLYAKCGCIEIARDIFELSPEKNLFTWNAMLVGLALHGHGQLVLDHFFKMIDANFKPDGISFLGVLVGCSHAGLVDEARKLFDEMEPIYGVARELKHYGCMADLLSRAGLIQEAREMIRGMPLEGDVFVWGGLLGGCRIHGDVDIAEKAAEQVMELKPEDGGVYSVMTNVYANAQRWDDAMSVRKSMRGKKVNKNVGYSYIQMMEN